MSPKSQTLGLISDTHGLMRSRALEQLRGVDRIVHAGDIGAQEVIDALAAIAPVTAIRGNMDLAYGWDRELPSSAVVEVGGALIYVLHSRAQLDLDPAAAGFRAVVFGHSHRPCLEEIDGVLFINPGSAGPRRFDYPVTLATLRVEGARCTPRIIDLE